MTDPNQRAIGVEHNGQVWNGTNWVPKPAAASGPPANWAGGSAGHSWGQPQAPTFSPGALPQFPAGGFVSPQYAYGLTKRASDDIHFIARFTRIMIWVWIVSAILGVASAVLWLAAIGSLLTHLSR